MDGRRWCKRCKAVFEGSACGKGHPNYLYSQKLPAEDLRRRVALSINQCLAALPLYPDAWFDAAQWHGDLGDRAGEIRMLQRGLEMLPDCLLLHFALAEKHEVKGDAEAAKRVYEEL